MNKLENSISDISSNYYKYLMSLENVNGVGLGFKRINNKSTLEPCIHVLVEKKVPSNYITSNNIIPKTYMGVKTDVIQSGNFIINYNTSENGTYISNPFKLRPLIGGSRLVVGNNFGTLGCIVYKKKFLKKEYFILSTNSVLANINHNPIGFPVIQNSVGHSKISKKDIVANLSNFIPLKTPFQNLKRENYVDCALAKIKDKRYIYNYILGINSIQGYTSARLGETVKKSGYTSGVTTGNVLTKSATIEVIVKNYKLIFKSQLIADFYSYLGDSGSIVLNEENKAVGLIFAFAKYSDDYENSSVFCDINAIQWLLDVEIYTGE